MLVVTQCQWTFKERPRTIVAAEWNAHRTIQKDCMLRAAWSLWTFRDSRHLHSSILRGMTAKAPQHLRHPAASLRDRLCHLHPLHFQDRSSRNGSKMQQMLSLLALLEQ